MNDKSINELINYINNTTNFKCNKLTNVIEIFYNNTHLLYINIPLITQIIYTKYDNKNNRVSLLYNKNKILIIYYTKGQYIFNI